MSHAESFVDRYRSRRWPISHLRGWNHHHPLPTAVWTSLGHGVSRKEDGKLNIGVFSSRASHQEPSMSKPRIPSTVQRLSTLSGDLSASVAHCKLSGWIVVPILLGAVGVSWSPPGNGPWCSKRALTRQSVRLHHEPTVSKSHGRSLGSADPLRSQNFWFPADQLQSSTRWWHVEDAAVWICSNCKLSPLTTDSIYNPTSLNPLSPQRLLTMKSSIILPPPGKFDKADMYCKRRWRRVQHLTNEFWHRWKREYLHTLQQRQKWSKPKRNLQVGDEIVKDDNVIRSQWKLGRVTEVTASRDGLVRKVRLLIDDVSLDDNGRRVRPATYLDRRLTNLSFY